MLHFLEEPFAVSDGDPAFMWFVDLQRHLEDLDTGIAARPAEQTKGQATLRLMAKEEPHEFAKLGACVLPKELLFADSTLDGMDIEQCDALITKLRAQMLAASAEELPN